MSCTVDPIAWAKANRVKLATGKTQEWLLARTQRDVPAVDEVIQTARAVMVKWFDGIALDVQFADAGSAVDDIRVLDVLSERPAPKADDQRREQMNPVPTLAPSEKPPLYLRISFNYRGFEPSLPWPVWGSPSSLFKADKLCPENADWMLVQAKAPHALAEAPPELGPLDKLVRHGLQGTNELAKTLQDLGTFTKMAGYALIAYGAIQIAGFIPKSGGRVGLSSSGPRRRRRA